LHILYRFAVCLHAKEVGLAPFASAADFSIGVGSIKQLRFEDLAFNRLRCASQIQVADEPLDGSATAHIEWAARQARMSWRTSP